MIRINIISFLRGRREENLFKSLAKKKGLIISIIHTRTKLVQIVYEMMFDLKYDVAEVLFFPRPNIDLMFECTKARNNAIVLMNFLIRLGERNDRIIGFIMKYLPAPIWPPNMKFDVLVSIIR